MSKRSTNTTVIPVKSTDNFTDKMLKSRTDSSTDMNWERQEIMCTEGSDWGDSLTISSSLFAKPKRNKSEEFSWAKSTFLQSSTASDPNAEELAKLVIENNEEDLKKLYKMTPELTCVCMKLIWDFLNTDGKTAEEYVHDKILLEFNEMSEWEIIVCIEVFYSFLEKIQVLELVMKGFKRSLGKNALTHLEDFQMMQMKVLIYLVLFESVRIGIAAMTQVLMSFSEQNFRKLYFYLSGQLRFDSPLKLAIFTMTGEDYFNRLVRPNLHVAEKLTRKVPRILHYLNTKGGKYSPNSFLIDLETFLATRPPTKSFISDMTLYEPDSSPKSTLPSSVSLTDIVTLIEKDEQPDCKADVPYEEELVAYEKDMEEYLHLVNPLGLEDKEEDDSDDDDTTYRMKTKKKLGIYREPIYRGKQTVTTILRERLRLEKLVVKEKYGDYETVLRELQEQQKEVEIKAAEKKEEEKQRQKLLLNSKLSYHRAIAAARDTLEKKQGIGQEVRIESEQLRYAVEEQRLKELEEKQNQAKIIAYEETERMRKAAEAVKKQKHDIANKVKKDKQELLRKCQVEEYVTKLQRLDTIKKIQACHGTKNFNFNPQVQHEIVLRKVQNEKNALRLNMSRMEQKEKLNENKKKIQELKQNRLNNIANAQNDIEIFRMSHTVKRSMEKQINKVQREIKIESEEDEEIVKIKEELEKLKNMNKPSKSSIYTSTNPSSCTFTTVSTPTSKRQ